MRIFLTGACGFAGQAVTITLLESGLNVVALVRSKVDDPHCQTVVADLSQPAKYTSDIESADAIVHLASSRSRRRSDALADVNNTGNIIVHWKRGPFILAGSAMIYAGGGMPLGEDAPLAVYDGYVGAKLANEFQLRIASLETPCGPAVVLRPGTLIGSGPRRNRGQMLAVIYNACRSAKKFVFDSEEGLNTYGATFLGTSDFGRAIVLSLGVRESGVFNVGGEFRTWREIIEVLSRSLGLKAQFVIRNTGPVEEHECALPQSRRLLDITAFRNTTGFAPKQNLDELLQEYLSAEQLAAQQTQLATS